MKTTVMAAMADSSMGYLLDVQPICLHSVFNSAVNIKADVGLITLLSGKRSVLPRSLVLDQGINFKQIGFKEGMPVRFGKDFIEIANYIFDVSGAKKINLNIVMHLKGIKRTEAFYSNIQKYALWVSNIGGGQGLSVLLSDDRLAGSIKGIYGSNVWSEFIIAKVILLLDTLSHINESFNPACFYEMGRALAGCGPGLTPSSDDFILGILAGLYALSAENRINPSLVDKVIGAIYRGVEGNTGDISTHFIQMAAKEKLFADDIIRLIKNLYSDNPDKIKQSIRLLSGFGSSSGCDIMTGIYYGIQLPL